MTDPLTVVFVLVVGVFGSLDAYLLLRDLPAKARARRLHRRNRRWVRALPARPARPDSAGRAGPLTAAGVPVTTRHHHPATPAVPTHQGHQP